MDPIDPRYGAAPPGAAGYAPGAADPFGASRRVLDARRRQRWWGAALWVLATVVLALAAVTVGVSIRHSGSSQPRAGATATGTGPRDSRGRSSPPTTGVPGTPGGPTITSLSPAVGSAGQTVVITGSGMMSADGQVLARFGGVVAPTSCPTVSSCSAVVPPAPGGSAQVPVTVSTAGGTSNSLAFTYR